MPGHQICVWAQTYTFLPRHDCDHTIIIITCQGIDVCGHKHVWPQTCQGTNVCGHKRVRAQMWLGKNVSGHKRVWAQTCVGTNVSGHKRVWAQMCLAQSCGLKRVVSRKSLWYPNNDYTLIDIRKLALDAAHCK